MKTPDKTTLPISNLNNYALAEYLAAQRPGATFSAVIYKKLGKTRGGRLYGDDTVLDTVVTGFSYERLCERDLATLEAADEVTAQALYDKLVALGWRDRTGHIPSLQNCEQAILEQMESFRKSIAGTNESTTDHVREPVIVNGEIIKGCWLNNGAVDRAKTGMPYLYGLRVGRKVLEEAENGPIPEARSGAVPLAKRCLKYNFLRVGRWMSVRLDPSSFIALKLGGEAAALADEKGIRIEQNVTVREIYEAA